MTQSALPETRSRSSFANNGRRGAGGEIKRSGERKEDLLKPAVLRDTRITAQGSECAIAAHTSGGKQDETITDALCVSQLMNGKQQGASAASDISQKRHHFACL